MISKTSRYYNVGTSQLRLPGDRTIVYLKRRFLPPSSSLEIQSEYIVTHGDRLDNLAATYLIDPELFWMICDANGAMRPDDLTSVIGRRLQIPLP